LLLSAGRRQLISGSLDGGSNLGGERIRCSIRIWTRPHVKVGGRYRIEDGHIVVDSSTPMQVRDITRGLAAQ